MIPSTLQHFWQRWLTLWQWPGNPWFPRPFGQGVMGELHRRAAHAAFRGSHGRKALVIRGLLTLAWPLRLALAAIPLWRRFGKETLAMSGVPMARQLMNLYLLGLGYGVDPKAYYQFQLFRSERRAQLGDYLFSHEVSSLFPAINQFRRDEAVEDKGLFAGRCREARLPCVPTITDSSRQQPRLSPGGWPSGDLISKPASGSQGRGVMLWKEKTPERYASSKGNGFFDRSSLLLQLDRIYENRSWLLQPALANHPGIADLSPGPLICVRLMTAYVDADDIQVFAALLKMPVGRQSTNNHGIGAAIDLKSGELGQAFPYRPLHAGFTHHPTTHAPIVGRTVPDWPNILNLGLEAHRAFPAVRLLGWDIALTANGPVLLETNSGWDVTLPQIASQQPLGLTPLRQCLARILGISQGD